MYFLASILALNKVLSFHNEAHIFLYQTRSSGTTSVSGLKATGIFVILMSQGGFESDCLETKFQTITS